VSPTPLPSSVAERTVPTAPEIHHVGLAVGDLERSVAFYCTHFGLREIARNHLQGELISEQTGLPGTEIDVAILAGSNTIVELLCYRRPVGDDHTLRTCDPGAAHVCIVVEDVDATCEAMRRSGVVLHARPCKLMDDDTKMVYVRDPDGVTVELLEPTAQLSLATLLARHGGSTAL
jgi:catechol 2,3-dioxygenase-like lactoylglutathione lyase family enzyme